MSERPPPLIIIPPWKPTEEERLRFQDWRLRVINYLALSRNGILPFDIPAHFKNESGLFAPVMMPLWHMALTRGYYIHHFLYLMKEDIEVRKVDDQFYIFIRESSVPKDMLEERRRMLWRKKDQNEKPLREEGLSVPCEELLRLKPEPDEGLWIFGELSPAKKAEILELCKIGKAVDVAPPPPPPEPKPGCSKGLGSPARHEDEEDEDTKPDPPQRHYLPEEMLSDDDDDDGEEADDEDGLFEFFLSGSGALTASLLGGRTTVVKGNKVNKMAPTKPASDLITSTSKSKSRETDSTPLSMNHIPRREKPTPPVKNEKVDKPKVKRPKTKRELDSRHRKDKQAPFGKRLPLPFNLSSLKMADDTVKEKARFPAYLPDDGKSFKAFLKQRGSLLKFTGEQKNVVGAEDGKLGGPSKATQEFGNSVPVTPAVVPEDLETLEETADAVPNKSKMASKENATIDLPDTDTANSFQKLTLTAFPAPRILLSLREQVFRPLVNFPASLPDADKSFKTFLKQRGMLLSFQKSLRKCEKYASN